MLSMVYTASLLGIDASLVTVETDIGRGLPAINTVGLPSATIREAKERIRSAITNAGFDFPMNRVTVNLSPASDRKEGSHFDLPMAIGILISSGALLGDDAAHTGFIGELSLDGTLAAVDGALPLVMGLKAAGLRRVVVPMQNAAEAAVVKGITVSPFNSLREIAACMNGEAEYPVCRGGAVKKERESYIDFSEVKGQENAKRAITVSGAGGHGLYMLGVPGAGKSMLAKRIPTVLPPLTYEEMLEVTKIYSVAGRMGTARTLITDRPFRAPHHSITQVALLGGGRNPKPGEISLAHRGVLFLDELPEFPRGLLDMLRQPLESGEIVVERNGGGATFPCRFILAAAGNPCKCGYYGDDKTECRCSTRELNAYRNKISGPLLDRIDIQLKIERPDPSDFERDTKQDSRMIGQQIAAARELQQFRYKNEAISLNGELSGALLHKYCRMSDSAKRLLAEAYARFSLSVRSHEKVIKLGRTIADIEGSETIEAMHIAEALGFRAIERFVKEER